MLDIVLVGRTAKLRIKECLSLGISQNREEKETQNKPFQYNMGNAVVKVLWSYNQLHMVRAEKASQN